MTSPPLWFNICVLIGLMLLLNYLWIKAKREVKTFALGIIILILLSGCSQSYTQINDKIDITNNIQSCIVFYDHYECKLIDGKTYYVMKSKINQVTSWDKSAWKENQ